jgi:hypothetical protein
MKLGPAACCEVLCPATPLQPCCQVLNFAASRDPVHVGAGEFSSVRDKTMRRVSSWDIRQAGDRTAQIERHLVADDETRL